MRILLLEDRTVDAELVARELRRGGVDADITRVDAEEPFREAVLRGEMDVILADYHLPSFDGLSALAIARELVPDVPFIFVSGSIGEERAVEALRNGATDYVLKDRMTRLPNAVVRALQEREAQSARHRLEQQLEQARRITSLGRIAATMAHEFNNVLMGIQPFVEVMERTQADARVQKIAQQIARSVHRGKAVTQEILRFVNDGDVERAPVDVASWLDGLTGELRALLQGRELLVDIAPEPLWIEGDADVLQQVMTNLVINARDAMPRGGSVTIRAQRAEPCDIGMRDAALHLSITDTGTGIEPEVLDRIFEPMFTTKRKGNGLGLAFAHQVVTRHGGQI
ncbi:MAG: ATP-binding protein, partial [Thermoanaerobaculia bacterium]